MNTYRIIMDSLKTARDSGVIDSAEYAKASGDITALKASHDSGNFNQACADWIETDTLEAVFDND